MSVSIYLAFNDYHLLVRSTVPQLVFESVCLRNCNGIDRTRETSKLFGALVTFKLTSLAGFILSCMTLTC